MGVCYIRADYMRVALVHDWLNGMRGGEKVLEAFLEMWPQSTIFTLFHQRGRVSPLIESQRIVVSWLDRIPGVYRHYRNLLPLFPSAIQSLDVRDHDLIVSSSHAVAKGVRAGKTTHFCYCHTPMRYIWDAESDYQMGPLKRAVFRSLRGRLRRWDVDSSRRVDRFIANSHFVQDRIRRYYDRESVVVPPPIDTDFFSPSDSQDREDFYLAVGALVPYKRFDLLVRAFNTLGRRLIVAGSGPEERQLRALASSNVDIRGWVSNEGLRRLYRTARALVYAGCEDFGMVAVEAQSCGCPVIAYRAGGMAETVREGTNGLLFGSQTEHAVIDGVGRFEKMNWPRERVTQGVEEFSREAFKVRIRGILESHTSEIAAGVSPQTA
jgi:glycosyltransferase involved in cell wall biosynthesis